MRKALSAFVRKNQIVNFDEYNFFEKLAILQKTPKDKILMRKIGNQVVKYLPHDYCQKVLNFLFGFKVSNTIDDVTWNEYIEVKDNWVYDKSQGKRVVQGKKKVPVVECDVTVTYTFVHPDGTIITRTVGGSHKQFHNPAVTRGMCKQAAISKSWTAVARTFGIGRDLETQPEDVTYDKIWNREEVIEVESSESSDIDPELKY